MKLNMLLRVTREAGMLYEEMLTHSAQKCLQFNNVLQAPAFYTSGMFHSERYFEGSKWILFTTRDHYKSVALYSYFVNCCIITIGEQILLKIFRGNFWNFYENIYISIHLRNDK